MKKIKFGRLWVEEYDNDLVIIENSKIWIRIKYSIHRITCEYYSYNGWTKQKLSDAIYDMLENMQLIPDYWHFNHCVDETVHTCGFYCKKENVLEFEFDT